jgi:hypothetical protein
MPGAEYPAVAQTQEKRQDANGVIVTWSLKSRPENQLRAS